MVPPMIYATARRLLAVLLVLLALDAAATAGCCRAGRLQDASGGRGDRRREHADGAALVPAAVVQRRARPAVCLPTWTCASRPRWGT